MPVDPATEAIAEQIMLQLKAQLDGINQNAFYQISCVVEDAHERGNATAENKIIVELMSLGLNEVGGTNRDHCRMLVHLYCLAPASKTATTTPRTRMLRMHAAIWKTLRRDTEHTLGGLARDCVPQEAQFGEYKTTPGMMLPLEITFDTKRDNPFER